MQKNIWSLFKSPQFVGGQEESSVETRVTTAALQAKDEQALGIIITSSIDDYIHHIDDSDSVAKAWDILEYTFDAKENRFKICLKMQLYELTMEANESVASLVYRLKSLMT